MTAPAKRSDTQDISRLSVEYRAFLSGAAGTADYLVVPMGVATKDVILDDGWVVASAADSATSAGFRVHVGYIPLSSLDSVDITLETGVGQNIAFSAVTVLEAHTLPTHVDAARAGKFRRLITSTTGLRVPANSLIVVSLDDGSGTTYTDNITDSMHGILVQLQGYFAK